MGFYVGGVKRFHTPGVLAVLDAFCLSGRVKGNERIKTTIFVFMMREGQGKQ